MSLSQRVRPLEWPWPEMDVNEAHSAGHDLEAWAIPQIGPSELRRREEWLLHWAGALEYDVKSGDATAQRVWEVLGQELQELVIG